MPDMGTGIQLQLNMVSTDCSCLKVKWQTASKKETK